MSGRRLLVGLLLEERHVRALARVVDGGLRASLTGRVRREHLSAEETEALVSQYSSARRRSRRAPNRRSWSAIGNLRYHANGDAFHIRIPKSGTYAEVVRELENLIASLRERGEESL